MIDDVKKKNKEIMEKWKNSPMIFINDMWGLKPQKIKAEYKERFKELCHSDENNWADEITKEWFEPFEKGNITWQQYIIILSVERAIAGIGKKRISIASGHGIGKSSCLSWLIIWYLVCFYEAQIPCTAPTSNQMHDVLWKELAKWKGLMRKEIADTLELINEYLRAKERPDTWFARAKTARKEAPEALAGIHGEYVMVVADEASGVPDEIYNTAEGSLTGMDIFFIMISNPTRTTGFFYDTHTDEIEMEKWQLLSFNSEDSPIVEKDYIDIMTERHGKDSDEYRIRVLGKFPKVEGMDDKGYIQLFSESEITLEPESGFIGSVRLGIDPSGEGKDITGWVARDNRKIKVLGKEAISNSKSIAEKTMTWMFSHNIKDDDIMADSFGVGADVGKELAASDNHYNIGTVNVGDNEYKERKVDDIYLNIRAEAYFRIKEFFKRGGCLIDNELGRELKKELLKIKYKRNIKGKIQIMSKEIMRKEGIKSPNFADALMLTFVKSEQSRKPLMSLEPLLNQEW